MSWIHIVYLLSLLFIAIKGEGLGKRSSFRKAWIAFALIPLWYVLMQLFAAGNIGDGKVTMLIAVWQEIGSNLLLGISLLCLLGVLAPKVAPQQNSLAPRYPVNKPE